jgi:hypothetical protein
VKMLRCLSYSHLLAWADSYMATSMAVRLTSSCVCCTT